MKGAKWKIGALLVRKPHSPVEVVNRRKRNVDGKRVIQYKVAPAAFAMHGCDPAQGVWVDESELSEQPQ